MSSTTTIKSVLRKERGLENLGGIVQLDVFQATDFTANWPKASDITAGKVTTAPPLKATAVPVQFTFDISTCKFNVAKAGVLGAETYAHTAELKTMGIDEAKADALSSYLNQGVVLVGTYKNGKKQVLGQAHLPMQALEEVDSGMKADDSVNVMVKFNGTDRYGHGAVFLDSTVTIPTTTVPATGSEPRY